MGMFFVTAISCVDSALPSALNTMQEPTLPLHLQAVWGYTSDRVGLVYMAGLMPALICE